MARRNRRLIVAGHGTAVLDCQGLSLLIADDARMMARIDVARRNGVLVCISAATVVEVQHGKAHRARRNFVLSRLDIVPVSPKIALRAADLLDEAGLHGHKYAIDAMVVATALEQSGPVVVYTSDPEDLMALCESIDKETRPAVIPV